MKLEDEIITEKVYFQSKTYINLESTNVKKYFLKQLLKYYTK